MTAAQTPEGFTAWSSAQLGAVAALQQDGRQYVGDQYRSHVLKADGTFTSDLGAMIVPEGRRLQVARMIGEHRWAFVVDSDGLLVDAIPATWEAVLALRHDKAPRSIADDQVTAPPEAVTTDGVPADVVTEGQAPATDATGERAESALDE